MAYPLPAFHFAVDIGGTRIHFSEATGLSTEVQVIEYRAGDDPEFSTAKMPGLKKYGNITLKRGVLADETTYYEWLKTIKMNKVERREVSISLLNENHEPVMTWKVHNAWPAKVSAPDLKASANEAAIETLELAHEGIEVDAA